MPKRARLISKQNARCSQSSKKCSKPRQGDPKQLKNGSSNKRNRPSHYRQFDQATAFLRNHVVHGLANQLISHRRGNGNKTQRGFVQGLIDSANAVNSLLEITRDDVRNEVNRIIAASQKGETPAVALSEGISSTNGDLVPIAASSNSGQTFQVAPHVAQRVTASRKEASLDTPNGADALHVLAAVALERSPSRATAQTSVGRSSASSSIVQSLPNRCHFANCGAPSNLIPTVCGNQNCKRTLHVCCLINAQVNTGLPIDPTQNRCDQCFAQSGNGEQESSPPKTANPCDAANEICRDSGAATSNSNHCNCCWNCDNKICRSNPPDKCSVCGGAVNRICQGLGENARGWTSSELVLFCPSHHPDSNVIASKNAGSSAAGRAQLKMAVKGTLIGIQTVVADQREQPKRPSALRRG